jgi:hypothetical protein
MNATSAAAFFRNATRLISGLSRLAPISRREFPSALNACTFADRRGGAGDVQADAEGAVRRRARISCNVDRDGR